MKVLVLNGSPRQNGTVAALLRLVADALPAGTEVDWVDVCSLHIKGCKACMACRQRDDCVQPEDDGHRVGQKIREADALIVGTPTHWGNMCAPLKLLFDRNVPVFMGETARGYPVPRQRGKKAVVVTACTTPWPFNFIFSESRGAISAVSEILRYGGYRVAGTLVRPGTRRDQYIGEGLRRRAAKLAGKLLPRIVRPRRPPLDPSEATPPGR